MDEKLANWRPQTRPNCAIKQLSKTLVAFNWPSAEGNAALHSATGFYFNKALPPLFATTIDCFLNGATVDEIFTYCIS